MKLSEIVNSLELKNTSICESFKFLDTKYHKSKQTIRDMTETIKKLEYESI